MSAVPAWLQIMGVIWGILFSTGATCAFFFVIWPAIRRQRQMAEQFIRIITSKEAQKFVEYLHSQDLQNLGNVLKQLLEFLTGPEFKNMSDGMKKIPEMFKDGISGFIKASIKNSL
jgi:hypothetical protein